MSTSRHDQLASVFRQAIDREGAEREAFLDTQCGDNAALRAEVEALLANADAANSVFSTPDGHNRMLRIGQKLTMPDRIDGYELTDVLGDGGMAVVYLARQTVPRRNVALKMIKQGMDTRQIVSRFESEREAIAMMDHPNIAQVFDAGATAGGKPYFVMEYVGGQPVNRFCEHARLPLNQRLELMLDVCNAVEHAHQKGVIHRDLKPSNILVSRVDGRPLPKIIDFGIAKSIGLTIAGSPDMTRHGQVVGTPAYMSPEQAGGSAQDIDTRADVFSIGVVLYELLVGELPFGADGSEQVLERPSVRFRHAASDLQATRAQQRGTSVSELLQSLRGDLDWILLKALERQRERRYSTASALARDLRRHLDGMPVEAHPPSLRYQLGRFSRRNRFAVVAAASVLAMLVVSVVALFIGFTRAVDAQRAAEQAEAHAASQATLARRESARAQAVTEFLVDLFEVSDPGQTRGNSITAREILDLGVSRVEQDLKNQPGVQASLLDAMARVYMNLGLYDDAEPLAQYALEVLAALSHEDDYAYAQALRTRGLVYFYRGDFPDAESLHAQALAINRKLHGNESLLVAENQHNLANAVFEQGRYAEARVLFEEVLATRRSLLPTINERTADSLNSLASALRRLGDAAGAKALYQESLDMRLALDQRVHPETALTLSNLGVTLINLREFAEAEKLLRRALEIQSIVFGESHPHIGTVLSNLGAALAAESRYTEAEPVMRRSVEYHRNLYGATHINTANAINNLGAMLHRVGNLKESERLFRESIAIFSNSDAAALPTLGIAKANLASNLVAQERAAEAQPLAVEALEQLRTTLPANHPWIAVAESILGGALAQLGESGRARALLEGSLPELEKTFGTEGFRTIEAQHRLALLNSYADPSVPAER